MPTGVAHLAMRPCGARIEIGDRTFAGPVLAGPRASSYLRTKGGKASAGVVFEAAALGAMFKVDARSLAGQHHALADVAPRVGSGAAELFERVAEAGLETRLDVLEAWLVEWVAAHLSPAAGRSIAHAARRLGAGASVATVAREAHLSERAFRLKFAQAVGLSPRAFSRVRRLQRVLDAVTTRPANTKVHWAELAHAQGFCDQAHLSREFKALTGMRPRDYLPTRGAQNHVPVADLAGAGAGPGPAK